MASDMSLEDLLDRGCASNEALQDLRDRELRGLKESTGVWKVDRADRARALPLFHFLNTSLTRCRLRGQHTDEYHNMFFLQVLIYDRTARQAAASFNALAARCIAIANMVVKQRGTGELCQLDNMLQVVELQYGLRIPPATVIAEEVKVWQLVKYRSNLPCVAEWLQLFAQRLSLISKHVLDQHLEHLLRTSFRKMGTITQRAPIHSLSLRDLAAGALGLSLAQAGLMDWPDLRPDAITSQAWAQLGLFLNPRPPAAPLSVPLSPADPVLEWLQRSAGMSLRQLQAAAGKVAAALPPPPP